MGQRETESVLFFGTQYSNLYTVVDTPDWFVYNIIKDFFIQIISGSVLSIILANNIHSAMLDVVGSAGRGL
jgi:hypothetical protein